MNILLTRPFDLSDTLPEALRLAGATVVWRPTIEIDLDIATPQLDAALEKIESFDWLVFTSTNAVASFWNRVEALRIAPARVHARAVAAVGPATAGALDERDIEVTFTASPHSAEGLIAGFARRVSAAKPRRSFSAGGRTRVLYPRAAKVLPTLVTGLTHLGALVTDVTAYETRPIALGADFAAAVAKADCVVFCSPSSVHAASAFRSPLARRTIACIGRTTADAARAAGLPVSIVPEQPTAGALASALLGHFESVSR